MKQFYTLIFVLLSYLTICLLISIKSKNSLIKLVYPHLKRTYLQFSIILNIIKLGKNKYIATSCVKTKQKAA